jgi:hypothetical protein
MSQDFETIRMAAVEGDGETGLTGAIRIAAGATTRYALLHR